MGQNFVPFPFLRGSSVYFYVFIIVQITVNKCNISKIGLCCFSWLETAESDRRDMKRKIFWNICVFIDTVIFLIVQKEAQDSP